MSKIVRGTRRSSHRRPNRGSTCRPRTRPRTLGWVRHVLGGLDARGQPLGPVVAGLSPVDSYPERHAMQADPRWGSTVDRGRGGMGEAEPGAQCPDILCVGHRKVRTPRTPNPARLQQEAHQGAARPRQRAAGPDSTWHTLCSTSALSNCGSRFACCVLRVTGCPGCSCRQPVERLNFAVLGRNRLRRIAGSTCRPASGDNPQPRP